MKLLGGLWRGGGKRKGKYSREGEAQGVLVPPDGVTAIATPERSQKQLGRKGIAKQLG